MTGNFEWERNIPQADFATQSYRFGTLTKRVQLGLIVFSAWAASFISTDNRLVSSLMWLNLKPLTKNLWIISANVCIPVIYWREFVYLWFCISISINHGSGAILASAAAHLHATLYASLHTSTLCRESNRKLKDQTSIWFLLTEEEHSVDVFGSTFSVVVFTGDPVPICLQLSFRRGG